VKATDSPTAFIAIPWQSWALVTSLRPKSSHVYPESSSEYGGPIVLVLEIAVVEDAEIVVAVTEVCEIVVATQVPAQTHEMAVLPT
jgi:hypothetical protein